jgi:NAD(P)-dependent dehydrogenase (short-subunit alcohol dehydrogenase family)
MARLLEKVAIVVGAGSVATGIGNGKATAMAFAREGARVLAVDVSSDAVGQTGNLIRAEGGQCETIVADVSTSSGVRAMVERCLQSYGRVDILHNNVGVMFPGGPGDLDEAEWDRAFALNIKPMFLACREVLPIMERQRSGSIINVGSISSTRYLGMPAIAYNTSKGTVIAFTSALAAQYGPLGIRVNTLTPGIVDTPVLAVFAERLATAAGVAPGAGRAAREASVPLRRFGSAWDVANAAVYLASDEAAYVSGANLVVDGGLSVMAPQPSEKAA